MNIFYLDPDPVKCAQAHCDRHVVKMVLETAQILSAVWYKLHNPMALPEGDPRAVQGVFVRAVRPPAHPRYPLPPVEADGPLAQDAKAPPSEQSVWLLNGQRVYAATHLDHPCVLWAAGSAAAYRWAWRLGVALADEYTYRYGREHASLAVLRTLEPLPPGLVGKGAPDDTPPAVVSDEYKGASSVQEAYRAYYAEAKAHLLDYTRRDPPAWLMETADAA